MRFTFRALAPVLLAAAALAAPQAVQAKHRTSGPAYRVLDPSDFQSFVKNWSPDSEPLCAVLASAGDWDAVMNAAAVMGPHKPYAPTEAFWRTNGILLLARVTPPADPAKAFEQLGVKRHGSDWVVSYRLKPLAVASYNIKAWLPIATPKPLPARVRFEEAGVARCVAALHGGRAIGAHE